ncbi:hypothetical protein BDR22DRAFT_799265 [Usnea florida]
MGQPSVQASNVIIYLTYGAFLLSGLYVAWRWRNQSKSHFLATNRTQNAIPLTMNFIASSLGSGILFSYPEISTIAGVQGLIVYTLSSSLPLLVFGFLGPIVRRKCPEGFVLTEWTRQRFGTVTALYLSLLTLVTLFLYMVAELSALQQIINALTGLEGLPAVIIECAVTTTYTSLGGFHISFITDNIQGAMVVGLVILAVITVGLETHIDKSLVEPSGLLESSLLGWQLMYILPVAVLTNDFFISGFWMRTFASKTDKDLIIGTSVATVVVTCILGLVGAAGLLAAWTGAWPGNPPQDGDIALFLLLEKLPSWVVGIVLVMVVSLSTAAFDSFLSAMVSTGSNDLFRNKLDLWWIRLAVLLITFPVIVVALKSPDILQIYLISDLVSASSIPVLIVGLSDACYWWRGFEVVVGGLENGLYADDWSAFGAFVAAPIGGLLWGGGAFALRVGSQWIHAKWTGHRFKAFDRPLPPQAPPYNGGVVTFGEEPEDSEECAAPTNTNV